MFIRKDERKRGKKCVDGVGDVIKERVDNLVKHSGSQNEMKVLLSLKYNMKTQKRKKKKKKSLPFSTF